MSGAFGTKRSRRRPTINITSLIDVMFLLIIFLTVSTTFREQFGIEVELPSAETSEQQDRHTPQEVIVTREGNYYFGQQQVDEAGLRDAMVRWMADNPEAPLVLRADDQADFGRVLRAIDIARDVGGTRLIIPTQPMEEQGSGD